MPYSKVEHTYSKAQILKGLQVETTLGFKTHLTVHALLNSQTLTSLVQGNKSFHHRQISFIYVCKV